MRELWRGVDARPLSWPSVVARAAAIRLRRRWSGRSHDGQSLSSAPGGAGPFPSTDTLDLDQALASRGSRLAASLIDGIVACVLMIPIFVSAVMADASGGESAALGGALIFGSGVLLIAFVVYQLSMLVREGQTIGKKAMNVRIVDYHSGDVPGWGKLLGMRYGLNSVLGNIPLYTLIDILLIFGEERRCIHDYLAGTKVVEA